MSEMTAKTMLHWLREKRELSFADIAKECQLSISTIRDLHSGRTVSGTPAVREKVARFYSGERAHASFDHRKSIVTAKSVAAFAAMVERYVASENPAGKHTHDCFVQDVIHMLAKSLGHSRWADGHREMLRYLRDVTIPEQLGND